MKKYIENLLLSWVGIIIIDIPAVLITSYEWDYIIVCFVISLPVSILYTIIQKKL